MPTILIVERLGVIKQLNIKKYDEDELYKKAGFKSSNGFSIHTTWNFELNHKKYHISLYGKLNGKVNQENKYDFPPPIDKLLFFGNCVLVNKNEIGECIDISPKEWELCYEHLFGGFEDIGDEDSEDEEIDSIENDPNVKLTKSGYIKDDFIVDDDEFSEDDIENSDEDDDDVSEEALPKVSLKKKPPKKSSSKKERKSTKPAFEFPVVEPAVVADEFLDCTSELSEESYLEE
jgi:hypothetical protein